MNNVLYKHITFSLKLMIWNYYLLLYTNSADTKYLKLRFGGEALRTKHKSGTALIN